MTDQTPLISEPLGAEAAIHVFLPLYTRDPIDFRTHFIDDADWHTAELNMGFYMRYIRSIFYVPKDEEEDENEERKQDPLMANALALQNDHIQDVFQIRNNRVLLENVRLYSFETKIAFLDMKMSIHTDHLGDIADICADLRRVDAGLNLAETEDRPVTQTTLKKYARDLLQQWGVKCRLFDHVGSKGVARADMFVAVTCHKEPDDLESQMYRIAEGLDSRYQGEPPEDVIYSQFDYLRWAVTSKGVCSVGYWTEDERTQQFIGRWIQSAETKHVVWYILAIHQRHAMYRKLNEISQKETLRDLRKYQEEMVLFNTKYRFALVAEDPAYQVPYQMLRDAKQTESVFADIDEEIERINDYHDSVYDRRNVIAMTTVSLVCMVSTFIDAFQIPGNNVVKWCLIGVMSVATLVGLGWLFLPPLRDRMRPAMKKRRCRCCRRATHPPKKSTPRFVLFLKNSKIFKKFFKKG